MSRPHYKNYKKAHNKLLRQKMLSEGKKELTKLLVNEQ